MTDLSKMTEEQLADKIVGIESHVKQANEMKKMIQAELCNRLKVQKEGQESQTFNFGNLKIVKSEKTEYKIDGKYLKANGLPKDIPSGIFVQEFKLGVKALKENFEEYAEVLTPYLTSNKVESVKVTKGE